MKVGYGLSPEERRLLNAKWDLEEARWAYGYGNYNKAGRLLRRASRDVINEPHPNSEEYRLGEIKEAEDFEQESEAPNETSTEKWSDPVGPKPERDEDGYLIR